MELLEGVFAFIFYAQSGLKKQLDDISGFSALIQFAIDDISIEAPRRLIAFI